MPQQQPAPQQPSTLPRLMPLQLLMSQTRAPPQPMAAQWPLLRMQPAASHLQMWRSSQQRRRQRCPSSSSCCKQRRRQTAATPPPGRSSRGGADRLACALMIGSCLMPHSVRFEVVSKVSEQRIVLAASGCGVIQWLCEMPTREVELLSCAGQVVGPGAIGHTQWQMMKHANVRLAMHSAISRLARKQGKQADPAPMDEDDDDAGAADMEEEEEAPQQNGGPRFHTLE